MISKSFSPKGFQSRFYDVKKSFVKSIILNPASHENSSLDLYANVIESGYTPGQILILFWTHPTETEPWTKKKMAFYNLWWKFVWAIVYTTAGLGSSRKITRILTALFWLTNKHQFKMINM